MSHFSETASGGRGGKHLQCLTGPRSVNGKLEGRVRDLHAHSQTRSLVFFGTPVHIDLVDVQRSRVILLFSFAVLDLVRSRVLVPAYVVVLPVHVFVDVFDSFGVGVCDCRVCFCKVMTIKKKILLKMKAPPTLFKSCTGCELISCSRSTVMNQMSIPAIEVYGKNTDSYLLHVHLLFSSWVLLSDSWTSPERTHFSVLFVDHLPSPLSHWTPAARESVLLLTTAMWP